MMPFGVFSKGGRLAARFLATKWGKVAVIFGLGAAAGVGTTLVVEKKVAAIEQKAGQWMDKFLILSAIIAALYALSIFDKRR